MQNHHLLIALYPVWSIQSPRGRTLVILGLTETVASISRDCFFNSSIFWFINFWSSSGDYCTERLAILENENLSETKSFIKMYGEERRLLYVAMTRAREEFHAISDVPQPSILRLLGEFLLLKQVFLLRISASSGHIVTSNEIIAS